MVVHILFGWIRRSNSSRRVLVNGTFHNPNWFHAHISPLASSGYGEVTLVTDERIVDLPHLTYSIPPTWMNKVFSRAGAKFLVTLLEAIKNPPDICVGYHIFPSAITAIFAARLTGARVVYQVTSGPLELEGGGYQGENPVTKALGRHSNLVERLVMAVVKCCDLVVVRGSRAERFLRDRHYEGHLATVTGSVIVDDRLIKAERDIDILFAGRLTEYKRPDRFLRVIHRVTKSLPDCRISIAGEGQDRAELEALADELGISHNVKFLGQRSDVPELMGRSKIYTLTSRWEGVSIAMLEAMAVKTVPIVTDVGDLRDFAVDGETGFVFAEDDLDGMAEAMVKLLSDDERRSAMGQAAHEVILHRSERVNLSKRWQGIFIALWNEAEEIG